MKSNWSAKFAASLVVVSFATMMSPETAGAQQATVSTSVNPDDAVAGRSVTSFGCHIRPVQPGFGARALGQPGYDADLKLPDCQPDRTGTGVIPNSSGRAPSKPAAGNNLINHGGPVMPTATDYFISLNCNGNFSCWGNPGAFITDLYAAGDDFVHILDQYVNSTVNGRYALSGSAASVIQGEPHIMQESDVRAAVIAGLRSLFPNGGGGGYDKFYTIFLPQGQDTCFSGGTQCYSPDNPGTFFFCAYHSFMDTTDAKGNPIHVIYAVEPFQDVQGCRVSGGPNGSAIDSTNNTVSHEHFEALSDPDLNAWFDSGGNEIGDKCNFQEVTFTINVNSYRVQSEWDNITSACATKSANQNPPPPPPPPGVGPTCNPMPRLVDFNGDGKADMLLRRNDGLLALYLLNGFNLVSAQVLGQIGPEWTLVATADFNGDGKADMLFRRADGTLLLYLMNGFNLIAAQVIGQIGPEWTPIGVSDFNGDGKADMLFRRNDGLLALYLMNGFNLIAAQVIGQSGPEWRLVGLGDFNGDGKADMLMRRTDGLLALYLMNGFNVLNAQVLGQIGAEWTFVTAADFNGDGKADMLFRLGDGTLSLYLMNGFNLVGAQVLGQIGVESGPVGMGDFNGDGKTDMLYRRVDGYLTEFQMNGFNVAGFQVIGQVGMEWSSCFATAVR